MFSLFTQAMSGGCFRTKKHPVLSDPVLIHLTYQPPTLFKLVLKMEMKNLLFCSPTDTQYYLCVRGVFTKGLIGWKGAISQGGSLKNSQKETGAEFCNFLYVIERIY